jgi:hypothetical protein
VPRANRCRRRKGADHHASNPPALFVDTTPINRQNRPPRQCGHRVKANPCQSVDRAKAFDNLFAKPMSHFRRAVALPGYLIF